MYSAEKSHRLNDVNHNDPVMSCLRLYDRKIEVEWPMKIDWHTKKLIGLQYFLNQVGPYKISTYLAMRAYEAYETGQLTVI